MNKLMYSAGFALAICSSPARAESENLEITEARNAAAGFAVTNWMTVIDSLGTHCSELDDEAGKRSMDALLSWQAANMPYVDAAMRYMIAIEDLILARHGENARLQFRNDRKAEFLQAAHSAEEAWFPDRAVDPDSCLRLSAHVADGALDLDRHAEFYPTLRAIMAAMNQRQE